MCIDNIRTTNEQCCGAHRCLPVPRCVDGRRAAPEPDRPVHEAPPLSPERSLETKRAKKPGQVEQQHASIPQERNTRSQPVHARRGDRIPIRILRDPILALPYSTYS